MESIIRIAVEGSSGMTSIEDSFSDKLVITPSEINYTSDPHGIHDAEAVSKWSYKTNSQAFEALYKQLAAVLHAQAHFARCAYGDGEAVGGVDILYFGIGSPFDSHLLGFVYKINLTVEGSLIADGAVEQLSDFWYVLCFQRIPARPEQVKRLPVHEKYGFLRFVHDKLCKSVEIFAWVLPDEGGIIPLVFDYICNLCH